MRVHNLFREYIWLVNIIYQRRKITLREINEAWVETDMSEGLEMVRSTFNRHRIAIEEMFGLYIECDNEHRYYIGNARELERDSVQNWMLSTMTVSHLLSESVALKDRILLERVPVAGELLNNIIEAMKKNRRIEIMYHKYTGSEAKQLYIEPYCVKMYQRRWYILGHFENGNFGMFSLDRIESMKVLDEKFKMPRDFSCEEYFSECFGIVQGDGSKPEKIVIRAYGSERYNLRDLPIHPTQKELPSPLGEGQGEAPYTDFEITMRPTLDFNAYVLSRTRLMKVLKPQWLKEEIMDMLSDTLEAYDNDDDN